MDQQRLLQINASILEEERIARANTEKDRRNRIKQDAYNRAHPEEARAGYWVKFVAVVVVGLVLLWAHYGPIVRDAIYGVTN